MENRDNSAIKAVHAIFENDDVSYKAARTIRERKALNSNESGYWESERDVQRKLIVTTCLDPPLCYGVVKVQYIGLNRYHFLLKTNSKYLKSNYS